LKKYLEKSGKEVIVSWNSVENHRFCSSPLYAGVLFAVCNGV